MAAFGTLCNAQTDGMYRTLWWYVIRPQARVDDDDGGILSPQSSDKKQLFNHTIALLKDSVLENVSVWRHLVVMKSMTLRTGKWTRLIMYSQSDNIIFLINRAFHYQNNWSEFVENNISLKLIWKYFSELCTLVQGNATDTFNLIAF